MKIWAIVRGINFRAVHRYPDADKLPNEIAKTLIHPHSHRIYVDVWVSQNHTNRDVEYITLEDDVRTAVRQLQFATKEKEDMSCEDMAVYIHKLLKMVYDSNNIIVEVFEDGVNGARVGDE